MNFMNELRKTQDLDSRVLTENGAVSYKTTGHYLLDLNFSVASLRGMSDKEIYDKFSLALEEDPILAMRWLFFARDIRGGLGERNTFRVCLKNYAQRSPHIVYSLVELIPEYGRWDDLWCLFGISKELDEFVFKFVHDQLKVDIKKVRSAQPISLLAKWMPSVNTSSKATRELAYKFIKAFNMTEKTYRKTLSELRAHLNVVETTMSSNNWEKIDYEAVPSRANLLYKDAFMRHDPERRTNYLGALKSGEAKINASVLFPHDVVHSMNVGNVWDVRFKENETAEELWKALPDFVKGDNNTIVVADGSGSMETNIGNSNVTAWEVAHALAIYFAQHSSGQFANKYITFSSAPQFVDLNGTSLYENLCIARTHSECANTNVEGVFDLILDTARRLHLNQNEIPRNILIISDMEFDACTRGSSYGYSRFRTFDRTLFEEIQEEWAACGYKLPRLVFWNVNSRTGAIPVRENDMGVTLVSGFSPVVCNMVLSGELDPYRVLVDTLMSKRYDPVQDALSYWY